MIHTIANVMTIVSAGLFLGLFITLCIILYKKNRLLKKIQVLIDHFDKLPSDLRISELEDIKKVLKILDEYEFKVEVVSRKSDVEECDYAVCSKCAEKCR